MDLVGREPQLAQLSGALADAVRARGGPVLVPGEPGIGKSSLVEEFADRARSAGAAVLWGFGWEDGGAPSYWPWIQVIRHAGPVGGAAEIDALSGALGPLGPTGAAADRFQLFDAVARVLESAAGTQPVVVVIEDLHASGAASAELFEFVARHLRHARVLPLATYRSAEVALDPGLSAVLARVEPRALTVAPTPLGSDGIRQLLRAHRVGADDALIAQIADRTQGNPMFVAHIARHLASGHPISATGLPLGLREALRRLAGRVAAASEWPECMAMASVLGPDLRLGVLAAMLGASPTELAPVVERAVAADLMRHDPNDGDRPTFTHALVWQAIREGLPPADRAALHLRAARALEEDGAGAARLAHHFYAAWPAGGAREAYRYARRAGESAMAALAYGEAADAFESALTAFGRSPDAARVDRCELLLELGTAQSCGGRAAAARRTGESAAELAADLGDAALLSRAAILVAEHLPFNAIDPDAIALLLRADAAWDGAASPLRAHVLARAASASMRLDRDRAAAYAHLAERVAGGDTEARGAAMAAQLYVEWGRHDPRSALVVARRIADLAPDPRVAVEAELWTLGFALELGDLARAERALTAVEAEATRTRRPDLRHLGLSRRAAMTILRGSASRGRELAHEARSVAADAGLPDADAVYWGQLYALWRIEGLPADAAAEMESIALHLTEHSPFRYAHEAAVVAMLAARGEYGEATARFDTIVGEIDRFDRDLLYVWNLATLADACTALERVDSCRPIYDALLPFAPRFVVAAGAVVCLGSVAHQLGRLAALCGRPAAARAHLSAAVDAHRHAGCPSLIAASVAELARLSRSRLTIAPEGAVVLVQWDGVAVRLSPSLGLTYLAALVANPGTEIEATRLSGLGRGAAITATHAEEVLDRSALASYRQRLAELDTEIAEIREWHDIARTDALERERAFLLDELRGALGRGGRPRRFADETERARVNVTRAIRSAIRKVAGQSPDLGRHLEQSVQTGGRCRYLPRADVSRDGRG